MLSILGSCFPVLAWGASFLYRSPRKLSLFSEDDIGLVFFQRRAHLFWFNEVTCEFLVEQEHTYFDTHQFVVLYKKRTHGCRFCSIALSQAPNTCVVLNAISCVHSLGAVSRCAYLLRAWAGVPARQEHLPSWLDPSLVQSVNVCKSRTGSVRA